MCLSIPILSSQERQEHDATPRIQPGQIWQLVLPLHVAHIFMAHPLQGEPFFLIRMASYQDGAQDEDGCSCIGELQANAGSYGGSWHGSWEQRF